MKFRSIKKKKLIISILSIFLISAMQFGVNNGFAAPGDEDSFENNDNASSPWYLNLGYYSGLYLADEDWFSFDILSGETVIIEIWFSDAECDIDIELYDEFNFFIDSSTGVSDSERIEFTSQSNQEMKINIYSADIYSNAAGYSLDIYVLNVDDEFEENDYFGEARFISNFWPYSDLSQWDDDWYYFWLEPYDNLEILLYYDIYTTELNMSYYGSSNILVQLDNNQIYDGNHKRIIYNNNEFGKHIYLRVNGTDMGDLYDLFVLMNGFYSPLDDIYEPNDVWEDSTVINTDAMYSGLSQFDEDWYEIALYSDEDLEINCYYDVEQTYIYLELFDDSINHLVYDEGEDWTNGRTQLHYQNDYSYQIVYLRVYGENIGSWYELDLNVDNNVGPSASLDWVDFEEGDWVKWAVEIQKYTPENYQDNYQGSLEAAINDVYISGDVIEVNTYLSWVGNPDEYIEGPLQNYSFYIDSDGSATPSYFGYCSLLVGTDFSFQDFGLFAQFLGLNADVSNNGLSLILENNVDNSADNPWSKTTIHYTDTGLLSEYILESDYYDQYDNYIGIEYMKFTLSETSIELNSMATEDPFAIPGFPIEFLGLVSVCAIIILFKKNK